jgi:hypothetical protein
MKSYFKIISILLCMLGLFNGAEAQTNPPFIDQFPVITSVTFKPDPSATPGTVQVCKGKVVIDIELNDNDYNGNPFPAWIRANVILDFGASGVQTIPGWMFTLKGMSGPNKPFWRSEIPVATPPVNLMTATSLDAKIELEAIDNTGTLNPMWDWAYYTTSSWGGPFTDIIMTDPTCTPTTCYYATAEMKNITVPNNPTPQMIRGINALQTIHNGLCAGSQVLGNFELAQYTTNPNDWYHFTIKLYENGVFKTSIDRVAQTTTWAGCTGCPNLTVIPFHVFNFPIAFNKSYSIEITNVSVRTGSGDGDPLVAGYDCWMWPITAGPPPVFEYGPHSPNHKMSIAIPGIVPPAACVAMPLAYFWGVTSSSFDMHIDRDPNLGSITSPRRATCASSFLEMIKVPEHLPNCYEYRYRLELYETNGNFEQATATHKGTMPDVFNYNTTNYVFPSGGVPRYKVTLPYTTIFGGILAATNSTTSSKYYKFRLVGYVNNCTDIAPEVFREVFLEMPPSQNPNLMVKVNAIGLSTGWVQAKNQIPVRIVGDDQNELNLTSHIPLKRAQVYARLRRADTSGNPDLSTAGVLWSSDYNSVCFPAPFWPYNQTEFSTHFGSFGGNMLGFAPYAACSGGIASGGGSCPRALTDLKSFLGEWGTTAACATAMIPDPAFPPPGTPLGINPDNGWNAAWDRSLPNLTISNFISTLPPTGYYSQSANNIVSGTHVPVTRVVFLEVFTQDPCGGSSVASYLKLNVHRPTVAANPNTPIDVHIHDNGGGIRNDNMMASGSIGGENFSHSEPAAIINSSSPTAVQTYNMGRVTGYVEVKTKTPTIPTNYSHVILRLSRWNNTTNQWDYIFNPDFAVCHVLNRVANNNPINLDPSYNPFSPANGLRLPINNPYNGYTVRHLLGYRVDNQNLWVNGAGPNYFQNLANNAANAGAIFRIQAQVTNPSVQNFINVTHINGEAIAYFQVGSGTTLNGRGAAEPQFSQLDAKGKVQFTLENQTLQWKASFPEGGSLAYQLYDISGKVLIHQPSQNFDTGTYGDRKDVLSLSSGIYILRYQLNGQDQSIKLQVQN